MKFDLTFKMPDVMEQIDTMHDSDRLEATKLAEKYITYGEYITVEFDTDEQTATVRRNSR